MHYVKEDIEKAKHTNLYNYLYQNHLSSFNVEGGSLRLKDNHSISIAPDYIGFYDFATRESGDGIQFLMDYMGYTFQEAVGSLLKAENIVLSSINYKKDSSIPEVPKEIKIPLKEEGSPTRVIAYLLGRGISMSIIVELLHQGLLYQAKGTNNCVFINYKKDYLEQRGTITKDYLKEGQEPFRQVQRTLKSNFWYMTNDGISFADVEKILVCEAAIDAISLFQILHQYMKSKENYACVSIGGVANQETIERLVATGKEVVLAVDNDKAGTFCRKSNPGLPYLLPVFKDWNEDLKLYDLK